MSFSVLLSIYYKESPRWFSRAMQSIWDEQTVKPDEIVLVQDGPLTKELETEIEKWQEKLGAVLKCVPLEQNVGLGEALNIGLQYCSCELVARMDTDDIARPNRFEKQLLIFKSLDVDVCGAWITEFDEDEHVVTGVRKLPKNHEEIKEFAKSRCPMNHPAVMYKKAVVQKAGGYKHMLLLEDYYLWGRMLLNGAFFYNIQEPLVHMRAGLGQLKRRSGMAYAKSELLLFNELRKLRLISINNFLLILIFRLPIRLMPEFIVRLVYKLLR